MTVMDDIVKRRKANVHDISTAQDREDVIARYHTVLLFEKPAADSMASDATSERACKWYVPAHMAGGVEVVSVSVLPTAALTAHDTNNAVLLVDKNDGAGGARTNMATLTTNVASGNWVAFSRKAFTLDSTLANIQVAAGGMLTFEITKGGSGVAVPICNVVAVVKEL
jgi:hypothetical protein